MPTGRSGSGAKWPPASRARSGSEPGSLGRQGTGHSVATILPMGTLYLVRHGQASFGADDYDQLSDLGQRQAERLGRYWAERGLRFDAVLTGSLRRHAQTWQSIARGAGLDLAPLVWPGLNEYDSEAGIRAVLPCRRDASLGDQT